MHAVSTWGTMGGALGGVDEGLGHMAVRMLDERLRIRAVHDGAIGRLAVIGDLDAGGEPQLTDALAAMLDGSVGLLVIDMSSATFVSATALLEVAAVAETVPVQLTGAHNAVARVAAILGLTHLLSIDGSRISAA